MILHDIQSYSAMIYPFSNLNGENKDMLDSFRTYNCGTRHFHTPSLLSQSGSHAAMAIEASAATELQHVKMQAHVPTN